jgi:beta-glucosidase
MTLNASDFPENFVWGVATSAAQIEGAVDVEGRSPSIWDTFAHTEGTIDRGETPEVATDHYHRFAEDVDLMAELGVNAYRFSLSWSRILPDGVGEVNAAGIAFYRQLCEALIAKGITPFVTLYHWDLPQVLHERGGWLNPDSVDWFVEYAVAAKEALGDLIHMWTTFNEPHCTAFLGYASGLHAPGITDPGSAYVVSHHLMLAHHRAVAAMRSTRPHDDDRFGIVLNLIPAWADEPSAEAKRAAAGVDAIHNRFYASAVLDGSYPSTILDYMAKFDVLDQIDREALSEAAEPIDFLGMNYYNVNHIGHAPGAPLLPDWPGPEDAELHRPPGELTEMGWGVEPVGLTWMLNRVRDWAPDLPVYLMENGAAYADEADADGTVHDPERQAYIEAHLAALNQAMDDGVDVRGYFVWSLLDNFEWAYGYDRRFGLVRVDFDTLERTMKDSGRWYQGFLSS